MVSLSSVALSMGLAAAVLAEDAKGFLGVGMRDAEPHGAVVTLLLPERAGAKAGLQSGDVILMVEGMYVKDQFDAVGIIKMHPAGKRVHLTVRREGKVISVPVVLDAHPTAKFSRAPGASAEQRTPNGHWMPQPNSRMTSIGARLEAIDAFLRGMLKLKEGVYVTEVRKDSTAYRAGIRQNDVILQVDNRPVASPAQIDGAFANKRAGESVSLVIIRRGKRYRASVAIDPVYVAQSR